MATEIYYILGYDFTEALRRKNHENIPQKSI